MSTALLRSAHSGELLAAEIQIPPKLLEELLELLATAPFPINPELDHAAGTMSRVRFPLYESQLKPLRDLLVKSGLPSGVLEVNSMANRVMAAAEAKA